MDSKTSNIFLSFFCLFLAFTLWITGGLYKSNVNPAETKYGSGLVHLATTTISVITTDSQGNPLNVSSFFQEQIYTFAFLITGSLISLPNLLDGIDREDCKCFPLKVIYIIKEEMNYWSENSQGSGHRGGR